LSIRLSASQIKTVESKLYELERDLLGFEHVLQRFRSEFPPLNSVLRKIRELRLAVSNCKKDIEQYKRETLV